MNNVDSDHGDPVIVHYCCLCDFSLLRYEEDDPSVACSFRRYAAILLIVSPSVLRLVYLFFGILLILKCRHKSLESIDYSASNVFLVVGISFIFIIDKKCCKTGCLLKKIAYECLFSEMLQSPKKKY